MVNTPPKVINSKRINPVYKLEDSKISAKKKTQLEKEYDKFKINPGGYLKGRTKALVIGGSRGGVFVPLRTWYGSIDSSYTSCGNAVYDPYSPSHFNICINILKSTKSYGIQDGVDRIDSVIGQFEDSTDILYSKYYLRGGHASGARGLHYYHVMLNKGITDGYVKKESKLKFDNIGSSEVLIPTLTHLQKNFWSVSQSSYDFVINAVKKALAEAKVQKLLI